MGIQGLGDHKPTATDSIDLVRGKISGFWLKKAEG
jgi:hypothetical protein